MEIYDLKINGLENPMGFSYPDLFCSWKVKNTRAKQQALASIQVSLSPTFDQLIWEKEGPDLHCTGERIELPLAPYTTYYWRVKVRGDNGESSTSETCTFETAKQQMPWEGEWIGTSTQHSFHPELFRSFESQGKLLRARLYICGLGLFEAYINGEKVGQEYLAPFINDYKQCFQYMTYDVTSLVGKENTISVLLGNGWYKGRLGFTGEKNLFGDRFALIAELRLEYTDGRVETVVTDDSWQYRASFVRESDIYDGEAQDYPAYKASWEQVFPVQRVDLPKEKLCARYSMEVKAHESLPVKEVITTPAGETVLDMGQNFAGYMEIRACLPAGTKVTLDFGEVLQKGNFYHDNYRSAKSQFSFVADGTEQLIRPYFTFFGFRYVRVTGWPGEITGKEFTGRAVYSSLERIGFVETSHAKLNQLYSNSLWGLKSNFLDMPTDCPQRDERLGWTGDAQVFSPTASFHMDTRAFYHKYLTDLGYDQARNNGAVANFLPNLQPGESTSVWGDVATFVPMVLYRYYGDITAFTRHYPMMKAWVDYIHREDQKHSAHDLFDFGFQFGDWLALDGKTDQSVFGGTDSYFIASAYYYASAQKVAEAAEVLGKKEDAEYYSQLAEKIRQAILREYFTPNGRLAIDTQTAYLVALRFGIYHDKQRLIDGLKKRFDKDSYRIRGGFVGATMMCTVLGENGMEDLAYDFLFYEGFPGWLRCVNLGATTIWERWNSLLDDGSISGTGMNSLNHYSYGSVMEFVYRYTIGIQEAAPGFSKAILAPKPTHYLKWAKGAYDSASGRYEVEWSVEADGSLKVSVSIPFGCSALVRLPGYEQEEIELTTGTYQYHYQPSRDYIHRFSLESRLEQVMDCPEAMEILERQLPEAAQRLKERDLEFLSMTLGQALQFLPPNMDGAHAKEAIEEIMKL